MTRGMKVFGIALLFVAFDWLIAVAPFVACGLAVVIAIAWCRFLERHPAVR